ncbi:MAG: hypothetical protein PUB37_09540 [Firmicutes bacterium]|nr:hypothetical protein [Bacillota bacterium]
MKNTSGCQLIRNLTAGGIIFGMMTVSALLEQPEIIFPEIAALVTGALIAERQVWEVSRVKFVALMTISSLAGYAVSAFLPIPMLLKIFICFVFAAVSLTLTKCTLVPMISACILPLLMHTESIIYPISVFVLSVIIAATQWILEKSGFRRVRRHVPVKMNWSDQFLHWTWLAVCIMLYSIYPVLSGNYLFIAPPLIVMFAEMMPPSNKLRGKELKILAVTVMCAIIGSECRLILTEYLGLSVMISSAVTIILTLLLLNVSKVYFPPSAALSFLPFIVNRSALPYYTIYIAITASVICGASMIMAKLDRKTKNA